METKDKLNALAARANESHGSVVSSLRKAIHHAKDAGGALRTAKKRVGHGNWLKWLKENFDASAETARVYMRISEYWESRILPAMEEDVDLTIEKAREILRRSPSEIENGAMPPAKPWTDMARSQLGKCFDAWLWDLPEVSIVCLNQKWDKYWQIVMDELEKDMEQYMVKD